ncbi:hypothetical protein PHYBOEH_008707 [Phytophthora boehmeriae]|uniref:Serine aminopeptidase S33 domain-containing protein n=1 Tax=Phytophthora boehmeriae TaxID=109152 RepID=A0A8T1VYV5_9STRA|nr:hypothetical protein PHYBOEH_008707 [Phytophthora boehmeriae]
MATRPRVNSSLRALHMPAHLRQLEGKFKNARGQSLSYLALFPPKDAPLRAVVLYLHGIGDHSRRYFHLYERLCNAGFGVLAYDLLSHGASDSDEHGLRAHSARFHYFVDDTNEFITLAKTQLYAQLELLPPPMILSGMSYGTLVSLHTILSGHHDFAAVILVAPALLVEMTTTLKVQAVFARPLSKFIPKARIVPGVNGDYLCRDQEYVDDFTADPLTITAPVTARMGAETLKAMRALEADERVEQPDSALCKLPMLMLMGSEDKVTSLELAQVFFKRLAAKDKEFKVFDGYFHSLFDDPEREAVFEHLDKWLESRFPASAKVDTVDEAGESSGAKAKAADVKVVVQEDISATPATNEATTTPEVKAVSVEPASNTPPQEELKTEIVADNTTAAEEQKAAAVNDNVKATEEPVVESAVVLATVAADSTEVSEQPKTEPVENASAPVAGEEKVEKTNETKTATPAETSEQETTAPTQVQAEA